MRVLRSIFICFLMAIFVQCPFSTLDAGQPRKESAKGTNLHSSKSKIRPGDVDPGDAAIAGYREDFSDDESNAISRFQLQDPNTNKTYIFSAVLGAPNFCTGYFRVLEFYGYRNGKGERNERNHLVYAERISCPAGENPLRMIQMSQDTFIALFMQDFFGIYRNGPFDEDRLKILSGRVGEQDVGDFDGDGYIEIKVLNGFWDQKSGIVIEPILLSLYRFIPNDKSCQCSRFLRLKGKPFEQLFLDYANKMKSEEKITAWLTAIESTENAELIRKALDEFWKLPLSDPEFKIKLLKTLVNAGYPGLDTSNSNR